MEDVTALLDAKINEFKGEAMKLDLAPPSFSFFSFSSFKYESGRRPLSTYPFSGLPLSLLPPPPPPTPSSSAKDAGDETERDGTE